MLSFNVWSDVTIIGDLNFLDSIDFLTNQFLMPIGGMSVAIFAGWFFKADLALEQLSGIQMSIFKVWKFFIKFISPVAVAAVFLYQLIG